MCGWSRACVAALVALLAASACLPAHALLEEALDVLRLGKEVAQEVINSWDVIGKPLNLSGGVDLPIVRRREREVLARLATVARAVRTLELTVERTGAVALLLARGGGGGGGGTGARLELRLHEMADLLSRVAAADRNMREYVGLQRELERTTLEDFAAWCVSHDPGALPGLLERVHSLVVPPHRHLLGRGLFHLVLEDLQVGMRRPVPPRHASLLMNADNATVVAEVSTALKNNRYNTIDALSTSH